MRKYIPHRIMQFAELPEAGFPLLDGREPGGSATFYLCRDYACQKPVKTPSELLQLIDRGDES
jgi:uncharacterized protein YyaL (SSP411 family)